MNIIDLFCGTGGLSFGIEMASEEYNTIGGIDKIEKAVKTFNANHDDKAIADDITQLKPQEFMDIIGCKKSEIDMVVGGPPCQGFSTLQPDEDSDDERNYLYQYFADYVNYIHPEVVVMENVPEITEHKDIIKDIEQKLSKMDYNVEWRILNSVHYGVPQTRKRFILIGMRNSNPTFPDCTHYSETERTRGEQYTEKYVSPTDSDNLDSAVTTMQAIGDLPYLQTKCDCGECTGSEEQEYPHKPLNAYQRKMRDNNDIVRDHVAPNHSDRMVQKIQHVQEGKGRKDIPDQIAPNSGYTSSYGRIDGESPSNTLTSAFTSLSSNKCAHPRQNRAITIREGARIQSFPDDFTFPIQSKSEKARQVGNAVPPMLAEKIGEEILDNLRKETLEPNN